MYLSHGDNLMSNQPTKRELLADVSANPPRPEPGNRKTEEEQDQEEKLLDPAKRNTLAATATAAATALGGCLDILSGGSSEDVRAFEADQYAVWERTVNQIDEGEGDYESLSDLRESYDTVAERNDMPSVLSIAETGAVRIGENEVSRHVENIEREIPDDVVDSPDYIATKVESHFDGTQTKVDRDGDGRHLEVTFTDFDFGQVDMDAEEIETFVDENYASVDTDISFDKQVLEQAASAVTPMQLLAGTHSVTDQPIADPEILENFEEKIDNTIEEAIGVYHTVKDQEEDIRGKERDIKNSLRDLRSRDVNITDEEEAEEYLTKFSDRADNHGEFVDTLVGDIATLAVMKRATSHARERAENIYESSEFSEAFTTVRADLDEDEKEEETHGIYVGHIRNHADLDEQEFGGDEYLDRVASRLDAGDEDKLVLTRHDDGTGASLYAVNPENGEYEDLRDPELGGSDASPEERVDALWADLSADASYDGRIEA